MDAIRLSNNTRVTRVCQSVKTGEDLPCQILILLKNSDQSDVIMQHAPDSEELDE